MHAGFACPSCTELNLPLLLIQGLNGQGGSRCRAQGDGHRAWGTGTCVTPGVTVGGGRRVSGTCWGWSLLWINHQSRAASGLAMGALCSPVPIPLRAVGTQQPSPERHRAPCPTLQHTRGTLLPLQPKLSQPWAPCTPGLRGCQPMLQVGPAGQEELQGVLTAPRAACPAADSSWEDAAAGQV